MLLLKRRQSSRRRCRCGPSRDSGAGAPGAAAVSPAERPTAGPQGGRRPITFLSGRIRGEAAAGRGPGLCPASGGFRKGTARPRGVAGGREPAPRGGGRRGARAAGPAAACGWLVPKLGAALPPLPGPRQLCARGLGSFFFPARNGPDSGRDPAAAAAWGGEGSARGGSRSAPPRPA